MATGQPRHQRVDQQPQVDGLDRVVHVAQIDDQVFGQQRFQPHVGLAHHQHKAVDVRRFVVRHRGGSFGSGTKLNTVFSRTLGSSRGHFFQVVKGF